ncbi:MAG: UbiX family flavin prenyltransferase [Arsenophonus sp.]|nr:MAG: UbiX family flavin prenyltransferase [Arsenophonus sp.]
MKKKIIIGITGASGIIYSIKLLEYLNLLPNIETHLIISYSARQILSLETKYTIKYLKSIANVFYDYRDTSASIASGSFITSGMIVLPCSIKTLSSIANSYSNTLIIRAADVILKENRKLILCVRESPIHIGHIDLMSKVIKMGAIVAPPIPHFYHKPKKIEDIIMYTIYRIIDLFGIDNLNNKSFLRWKGTKKDNF